MNLFHEVTVSILLKSAIFLDSYSRFSITNSIIMIVRLKNHFICCQTKLIMAYVYRYFIGASEEQGNI